MDADIVSTLDIDNPEVSNDGSHVVDLRSGPGQVGDKECRDHASYEQRFSPVKSFVKGVHEHYDPSFSVPDPLEHRAISDLNEVDMNLENIEVPKEAADTEVVESLEEQESEQELNSDSAKSKNEEENNAKCVSPKFRNLMKNPCVSYQLPAEDEGGDNIYEPSFSVPEHLEHRATDDFNVVGTNIENVAEVQEEADNTEDVESQEEQEADQLLKSDSAKKATNDLNEVGTNIENVEEVQEAYQELNSDSANRATNNLNEVGTNIENVEEVQEEAADSDVVESQEEQEPDQEFNSDANPDSKEEKNAKRAFPKSGSLMKDHCVSYQLPLENEGEFAIFDLVWGKVKSHPWWPGQIFHPTDSSEKAIKYYKKDCYLVAYFGDRTFAWNEASVLKPFRNHFPLAERQNNSEAFKNAVNCALEEVSRRVELGLVCSCVSEEAYHKIKYQIVENSGIKEESSKREGVDRSTGVESFLPDKLAEYVRSLALFPTSGADRLEFVVAKSQLLAFNHLRGYDALPDFQYYEGLEEFDADSLPENQGIRGKNEHADSVTGIKDKKGPRKRKHNLKDIVYHRRKEKTMTELMGDSIYCLDGEFDSYEEDDIFLTSSSASAKKKVSDFTDDFTAQSMKTISLAKVSNAAFPNPQQSFKVGERISKVASQMTGSSAYIKGCSEGSNKQHSDDDAEEVTEPPNGSLSKNTPTQLKKSSSDDVLSQLHLSARNPMKGYSFLGDIISFFSEFRNLAVTTQRQRMRKGRGGRKKKSSVPVVSPETIQLDDRNDSYWTDMVVQGSAETKPARRGRKRKVEHVVSDDNEKPNQLKPKKYSRKKHYHGNDEALSERPTRDDKQLDLPAELLLNFGETGSVPSELSLNKMFRCFGPLKESDTVVEMQSNHARVVFKKRSDAEVAYSSAAMFNIFGSTLVNYQLNYTPSVTIKSSPLALTNGKEDPT